MSKYVDFAALGKVLGIGLGAGAGIVAIFAIGVVGSARFADGRRQGRPALPALLVTAVCFAACAAAIGYGIDLMMQK